MRSKPANDFGLFDAYGNVREWVLSRVDNQNDTPEEFAYQIEHALSLPEPPRMAVSTGDYEVRLSGHCGGGFGGYYTHDRNSIRYQFVGFRVVRTAPGAVGLDDD